MIKAKWQLFTDTPDILQLPHWLVSWQLKCFLVYSLSEFWSLSVHNAFGLFAREKKKYYSLKLWKVSSRELSEEEKIYCGKTVCIRQSPEEISSQKQALKRNIFWYFISNIKLALKYFIIHICIWTMERVHSFIFGEKVLCAVST